TKVIKNDAGEVVELEGEIIEEAGDTNAARVKGTIQWVSEAHSVPAQLRLFDRLVLSAEEVPEDAALQDTINPESLVIVEDARVEKSLATSAAGQHFQFERMGYFYSDPVDHKDGRLVFNRTVTLRDTWS